MSILAYRVPGLPHRRQGLEVGPAVNYFEGQVAVPGVKKLVEYTLALPENPTTDVLAVGVNGFAATKPTFDRFMGSLAREHGISTLHFDPARIVGSRLNVKQALFDPQKLHLDTLEAIAGDLQDNLGIARIPNGNMARAAQLAIIAHSMGDQSAVRFAKQNQASIDSVIHMAGNGLEGASGKKLIGRTAGVLARDILPSTITGRFGYNPRNLARSANYVLSNPVQTFGEILSCMTADIRTDVKDIKEQGIYQAFVGFNHDGYFDPMDALREIGQHIDYWTILDGIHTGPQSRPYYTAQPTADIIINKPTSLI